MKKLVSLMLALVLVLACLSGLCFAADAEATYTVNGKTQEGTLAAAVKAVSASGGTIVLNKDVNNMDDKVAYAIASAQSFTLDLNGHTINSVTRCVQIQPKATGVTVIKNGTLISKMLNVYCEAGGLQMENVTAWSDTQQNINLLDATGKWNKENLIQNCVLANPAWGAFVFQRGDGQSQEATSMTVKNSSLANTNPKGSTAIAIQTKAVAGNLVLGEGVKLLSFKKEGSLVPAAVKVLGEALTPAGTETLTVNGKTFEGMTVHATPAAATVDLATVIPAAPEAPEAPSAPVVSAGNEVSYIVGGVEKEGTMAAAVKAINDAKGGSLKLLKDFNFTDAKSNYAVVFTGPATVDLNGFKFISATRGIWFNGKTASGMAVVVDSVGTGYMDCQKLCVCVDAGGLYMNGVKAYSKEQQAVAVLEKSAAYNEKNIIENCTLVSSAWGAIAYNNTTGSMEEFALTVKNSTIANDKGGTAIVLQAKAVEAQLNLGEGVSLLTRAEGGLSTALSNALAVSGEMPAKAEGKTSVTVAGKTFDGFVAWNTAAPAEAPANVGVLPEWAVQTVAPVQPETPSTPAAPSTPSTPSTPSAPSVPQAPAQPSNPNSGIVLDNGGSGMNATVIIVIIAAVVVAAAVVVVVLKKKKK